MPHLVFALDVTHSPARAALVSVDGSKSEIVRVGLVRLPPLPTEQASAEIEEAADYKTVQIDEKLESEGTNIDNFIGELRDRVFGCVAIVPADEAHSVNLSLPFGEMRALGKIIDMEVQDVVPFDISNYSLHYKINGALDAALYDVHASFVSREWLAHLIK